MQLYFSPGACSLATHITLRELGIPVELTRVDTKTKKTADGADFYAISSKGAVPAMKLDNGQVLTEGVVLMQYLADQKGDSTLLPKFGSPERYRVLEWMNFITSEVHKGYSPLWNPSADPKVKEYALANLEKKLDWTNQQLAGKKFLTGDNFTIADSYLFTVINWSFFLGMNLDKWPTLKEFHARVAARPKVQEALQAEGLNQKAA
jgi:glutathione S-transferase